MHDQICVKIEAGRRLCAGAYGRCPSDFDTCDAAQLPYYTETCQDRIAKRKCEKKRGKGKCRKKNFKTRKCPFTCGECFFG